MSEKKLIIFSKAPIAGQVKTRLIPTLGIDKATQLHRHMLEQTVAMASGLEGINCELHCSPDINDDFFTYLSKTYQLDLLPQQGAQLGDKMAHAMETALNTSRQCIIIGTDCPMINESYIYTAFQQLDNSDVVLGPALDGGYVLIGGKVFDYQLFNDVTWSTSEVLNQTLKNINHLQLKYHKLDTLSDVDTHEDLKQLSTQYLHNAFHETTR